MRSIPFLLLTALLLAGCGHTNHLSRYRVPGAKFIFASYVFSSATADPARIINAKGELATRGDLRTVLTRVPAEQMASTISKGLRAPLYEYLKTVEVSMEKVVPEFSGETMLREMAIRETPLGTEVFIRSETRLLDKFTEELIWKYDEPQTIPLRKVTINKDGTVAVGDIITGEALGGMSDEEVRAALSKAAEEAGRLTGEVLKADVMGMKH